MSDNHLFKSGRFGLEYEALIHINDNDLWTSFSKEISEDDWKNPGRITDKNLNAVVNHLQNRDSHKPPCQNVAYRYITKHPSIVKRNILCHQFNTTIINNGKNNPITNKYWFRVADGYRKTVCEGPAIAGVDTAIITPSTSVDNKFTWVVTHDRSVVEEDENNLRLLQHMEMVSPPLKVMGDWGNIDFMISSVMNNCKWQSRHNIKTSNHVHFTLCNDEDSTDPIWIKSPAVLYDMCMAWWRFEPVFMMLCDPQRRSNYFCASMHRSIWDRYEDETFYGESDPSVFLEKIFKGDSRLMDSVLGELTPSKYQFKRELEKAWYADGRFFNADEIQEDNSNVYKLMQIIYLFQGHPGEHDSRYASLNLLNTITKVTTIESRLYEGSTDAKEVMSWINLIVLFFSSYAQVLSQSPDIREKCWSMNTFMYYIDWADLENDVVVNEGDTQDIQQLHNMVTAFVYMMRAMGVPYTSSFYDHWKRILNDNIREVYKQPGIINGWFSEQEITPSSIPSDAIIKVLEAPFGGSSTGRGGGVKKHRQAHVFLYGLDDIKEVARKVEVRRIKKQLTPVEGRLDNHVLKEVDGRIVISKMKDSAVHGTIVTLTHDQIVRVFGDTKLTSRDVLVGDEVIRCKMLLRGKGISKPLTKEQSRKVNTMLKQNMKYTKK